MQLNEIHNTHQHASVSLKVILLIFAVVLVGVLSYLVWQNNNTVYEIDNTSPAVFNENSQSEEATAELMKNTAGWKTFESEELGMSFRYPPSFGEVTTETIIGKVFNNETEEFENAGQSFYVYFSNFSSGDERIEACAVTPNFASDRGDSDACWITEFSPNPGYETLGNLDNQTVYLEKELEFYGKRTAGYIQLAINNQYHVLTISARTTNKTFVDAIELIIMSSKRI